MVRTILELLEETLTIFKQSRYIGLCSVTQGRNSIEYGILHDYILANAPTTSLYRYGEANHSEAIHIQAKEEDVRWELYFRWKPFEKEPRIKWLEEHIELNK